ncbi:MAG: L-lactate dehydrogenase [Lachnospiraceae bacterium]|jgi:L-lactate dehydrogenase
MIKKRKVAIIGLGHVGAHCAYSLALQGIVDELVLVDKNEDKVTSECQDLRDAVANFPHTVEISVGDYGDLGDVDIIVNAIGDVSIIATPDKDRLREMKFTIPQVTDYIPKIMAGGFHGIIVNITNPCDVVTYQIAKLSGLPRGHVFGTGTGLDSARLKNVLYQQTGIAHQSIYGCMMGEHGNSIMVPWSQITFGGKKLTELEKHDPRFQFDHEEAKNKVVQNAWVTVHGKHCTEYGICSVLARIVHVIYHDEKAILPVSTQLCGEYGEEGLFIGVPAIVGSDGIVEIVEYSLPDDEKAAFHQCCENVRHNLTLHPMIVH